MSALPSTTDIHQRGGSVSFVPQADMRIARATALSLPVISALRDGHAVDLDIERTGPLRDAEEDSGRRVLGEVAFVDLVEGLEALGGYAEHVALQHVIEVRPRRLQHCLHLFEDALGLALERRMLQELAGVRVEGRHAGHEHHVPSSGADRDESAPFLKLMSNGS